MTKPLSLRMPTKPSSSSETYSNHHQSPVPSSGIASRFQIADGPRIAAKASVCRALVGQLDRRCQFRASIRIRRIAKVEERIHRLANVSI